MQLRTRQMLSPTNTHTHTQAGSGVICLLHCHHYDIIWSHNHLTQHRWFPIRPQLKSNPYLATINQLKHKWIGYVLCHDVLLRDTLEGRMLGKHTRGRKRLQLISSICYEGTSYESVKKWAEDRCLWRVLDMEVYDLLYRSIPEEEDRQHRRALC